MADESVVNVGVVGGGDESKVGQTKIIERECSRNGSGR